MVSKLIEPLPGQQVKTATLRLPIDMYTHLATLATKERRTLQSQMLVLLEHALLPYVDAREKRDTPER